MQRKTAVNKKAVAVSNKLASSPDRNTFQKKAYLDRCAKEGIEPDQAYLEMWARADQQDIEWGEQEHVNDLEYDLRSTDWIIAKARDSETYAQNIYAALCNNEFQKIDVMPILKDERWSCTWRGAGGIVADLRGQGDYIDWYCSGMGDKGHTGFVSEGTVTDEIREDFGRLGWVPVSWDDD